MPPGTGPTQDLPGQQSSVFREGIHEALCVLFNYCPLADSRRGGGVVLHRVTPGEPSGFNQ